VIGELVGGLAVVLAGGFLIGFAAGWQARGARDRDADSPEVGGMMEPMTAEQALTFMFDTPNIPGLPYLCNGCGRPVRKRRRLTHANAKHPGWLDQWNHALGAV